MMKIKPFLSKIYYKTAVQIKKLFGVKRSKVRITPSLIMDIRMNDLFGKVLLSNGRPEPIVISNLLSLTKPGMTILDIGANIGYMTLVSSRAVGEEGRVISFEPNPVMIRELNHNIELNNIKNVTVVPIALSDKCGELSLLLPVIGEESHSSFRQNTTFIPAGKLSVSTETLDYATKRLLINKIDIMKIDVEGAELNILKGAKYVLSKYQPIILFESAENLTEPFGHTVYDVLSYVSSYGYTIKQICHGNWLACPHNNQKEEIYNL